ncbi:hypothetical protein B8W90_11400, partial [Staphylococcus hominis]
SVRYQPRGALRLRAARRVRGAFVRPAARDGAGEIAPGRPWTAAAACLWPGRRAGSGAKGHRRCPSPCMD